MAICALMLVHAFAPTGTPLAPSCSVADDQLREVQREFTQKIRPMLKAACGDCHWGESADAGFDLKPYTQLDQLLKDRKKWKKVEVRVAAKEMPPEDYDPLSDSDHKAVMEWLDQLLHSADCTNINPGHVTIRRLNRTEYKNTVDDLLGINYEPAGDFPGDDVGYGFDNIADVISLPPILMEKYLQAAEEITQEALVDPNAPGATKFARLSDFKVGKSARVGSSSIVLFANTTISLNFDLPESGKYNAFIRAYGDQGGDEKVKMAVRLNGRKLGNKTVKQEEGKAGDFEFSVRGRAGKNKLEIEFTNDRYEKDKFDRNLHVVAAWIQGPFGKVPETHKRIINGKVPEDKNAQKKLARTILNRYASKAFRRRATSAELDGLMGLYSQARSEGDIFETALRLPLQAILVSPHFLYKIESPAKPKDPRMLSDFELATSLSYFLWSTMPDDELFGIAAQGKLRNGPVYRQQIKRMLADKRSAALVDNFVAQWLQLRHLEDFQPDPDLFPGVDRDMRNDMIKETKLMIEDLIKRDAKITELLTAEFTFVNERLAKLYGIKNVSGEEFQRVSTAGTNRIGIMTQGSILTLTSNPTRTSPVKRGKWIMENLLGEEPPPPDPEAMQLEDQNELQGTVRERMEQHRSNPSCASCHHVMDELGFALEHYDAVGRWRDTDDGQRIDAVGELPDGTQFHGAKQLQHTINTKMREQFIRCITEKMLIYATGRGMEYYDECAIDKILNQLDKNDYRFSELVYRVATSDPFLKRVGEEPEETE